jgi:hypothetical protein
VTASGSSVGLSFDFVESVFVDSVFFDSTTFVDVLATRGDDSFFDVFFGSVIFDFPFVVFLVPFEVFDDFKGFDDSSSDDVSKKSDFFDFVGPDFLGESSTGSSEEVSENSVKDETPFLKLEKHILQPRS